MENYINALYDSSLYRFSKIKLKKLNRNQARLQGLEQFLICEVTYGSRSYDFILAITPQQLEKLLDNGVKPVLKCKINAAMIWLFKGGPFYRTIDLQKATGEEVYTREIQVVAEHQVLDKEAENGFEFFRVKKIRKLKSAGSQK